MIKDSSISGIIKSFKASSELKLQKDQQDMKSKVQTEFKKLSKEGRLSQALVEVYTIKFFDTKDAHLTRLVAYPSMPKNAIDYIVDLMGKFHDESDTISEDGFNLMTYLEYILNDIDPNFIFWCSYPQISHDIIEEADTYTFTLIQFDALKFNKNLDYKGSLHPLIKSFYYTWISEYKESTYDNVFRKAAAGMNDFLGATWDHLNILSTMKYEGSQNNGSILFLGDYEAQVLLNLEIPVPLSEYRQIRKLLQMSRLGHYLLIDSNYMAIGFGHIPSDESLYRIDFLDHLSWKLYQGMTLSYPVSICYQFFQQWGITRPN